MEGMGAQVELTHLLAGNLLPGFVVLRIKQRLDFEAAARAGAPDEVYHVS
jgi:hypothetical protein